MLTIEIPDTQIREIDEEPRLDSGIITLTHLIGNAHFTGPDADTPLRVKSAVVKGEFNILFSRNFGLTKAIIRSNESFTFDPRLWS